MQIHLLQKFVPVFKLGRSVTAHCVFKHPLSNRVDVSCSISQFFKVLWIDTASRVIRPSSSPRGVVSVGNQLSLVPDRNLTRQTPIRSASSPRQTRSRVRPQTRLCQLCLHDAHHFFCEKRQLRTGERHQYEDHCVITKIPSPANQGCRISSRSTSGPSQDSQTTNQ